VTGDGYSLFCGLKLASEKAGAGRVYRITGTFCALEPAVKREAEEDWGGAGWLAAQRRDWGGRIRTSAYSIGIHRDSKPPGGRTRTCASRIAIQPAPIALAQVPRANSDWRPRRHPLVPN
jgi:hypothetical protein